MNPQEFEHALHCADYVRSLKVACDKAGGGSWEMLKDMTFESAMHVLAPNGFRFCYVPVEHGDNAILFAEALPFLKKEKAQ